MSKTSHVHIDDIIVDSDEHFIIDTITKTITCTSSNKLKLMQYDHKSERYSFDMNRFIEGHDLMDSNRVRIHFINIGSNREKHPGLYIVDDVQIMPSDDSKITFTWLISQDATMLSGGLNFLVSFECIDGDTVLYRWSSSISDTVTIMAGMNNDNTIIETYADELLAWQNSMETDYIPNLVDECYVNRDFATSVEIAAIFNISDPDVGTPLVTIPYEEVTDADIDNLFNE